MALAVFMRGVNVGGHKTFKPAALARELADLDVVNIGAAGTFVIRSSISQAAVRAAFLRKLPFEAQLMICSDREIIDLAEAEPFPNKPTGKDVKRYVSVLDKRPSKPPRLPIDRPDGDDWQVRIAGVCGRFVSSLHRREGRALLYPNEVVEKAFGVPATTRNWNTIQSIRDVLERA